MSKVLAVLVMAAMLLGTVSVAFGDNFVAESVTDSAKMRAGGSMKHHTVCNLDKGTRIVVVKQIGDWYLVQVPKEVPVWISAKWVRIESDDSGVVAGDRVNLRATADTKYGALGVAGRGTQVKILARSDGWLKIVPPDSAVGWVYKSHLRRMEGVSTDEVQKNAYEVIRGKEEAEKAKALDSARVTTLVENAINAEFLGDLDRAEQLLNEAMAALADFPGHPQTAKVMLYLEALKKKRLAEEQRLEKRRKEEIKRQLKDTEFVEKMKKLYAEEIRKATPKKPVYIATGTLKGAGLMVLRRGTHTLVDEKGRELYTLRAAPNSGVDLYDWKIYEKKVGIVGVVKDAPGWAVKVIEVTQIDLIETPGEK